VNLSMVEDFIERLDEHIASIVLVTLTSDSLTLRLGSPPGTVSVAPWNG